MFAFLHAIGLQPIEWSAALAATETASPYIGQALDAAFEQAAAVIVLMTPDDVVHLAEEFASGPDDPETAPSRQARPNVLFEAGMAFGRHPKQTVLVEFGAVRPFSDVAGRHAVRLNESAASRNDLANRLKTAGCEVDTSGSDWLTVGDFTPPEVGNTIPKGRRLPSNPEPGPRLDAKFLSRSSGSDRIQIINRTSATIRNIEGLNIEEFEGRIDGLPIDKLPAHKSMSLTVITGWTSQRSFELRVSAETEGGEKFEQDLFLDLTG